MTITANTPWRTLSPVPYATWVSNIAAAGGPLELRSQAAYDAAGDLSGLALAMLGQESSYGTRFNRNVAGNHNPLNLRPASGDGYLRFDRWVDGIRAWSERITDPAYKQGIYAGTTTISDLINVYAPPSDSNDTAGYIANVVSRLNYYPKDNPQEASMTTYPVAGLPGPGIALPVPLILDIIPLSQPNQRPGITRQTPGYWVQHETANYAAGADARMHNTWLHNGAGGAQLSFHFCVDDHQIYQMIPISEVTWQAADGAGPGNASGVSCELCVNSDGDTATSRANAEALAGGIMQALGLNITRLKRHWDFNAGDPDRHHCPDHMMTQNYWPTFVTNVGKLLVVTPPPVPHPPIPSVPWTKADVGIHKLNGQNAYAFLGEVTAKKDTPIFANAAMKKEDKIGEIGIGKTGEIRGTVISGGKRIALIDLGEKGVGRARLSNFHERWPTP